MSDKNGPQRNNLPNRLSRLSRALAGAVTHVPSDRSRVPPIAASCVAVFLIALGVRLLHWQDSHVEIVAGKNALSGVFSRYQKEARRMLDEGGILYPRERPAAGDARMLSHPPGYSILLAVIDRVSDDPAKGLWLVQILCDVAAALLGFAIALELMNWIVALIAGLLIALSPQMAYYSLLLSPDSLAVVPILIAVYLIIRNRKQPKVTAMMLAGALIGVSCWLQSNVLLLPIFLAVAAALLIQRGKRWLLATALIGSAALVIAPITVRNLIVFHRFIPLSIQAGLSLVEGIGDFDKDGTLGMPRSDREARSKDAEWNGRPDYAASLWNPDGIDRDRTRLDRGLAVVRSHPGWFLAVTLRRAAFMLSYNESRARRWPFNTASVPPVSAEAIYGHPLRFEEEAEDKAALQSELPKVLVLNGASIPGALAVANEEAPSNSILPTELKESGVLLSQRAGVSLELGGQALQVVGDDSQYGDQFQSAPIALRNSTDYVLELPVAKLDGDMALKVTSVDRRIAVASAGVTDALGEQSSARRATVIQMPFASGNRTQVRLVVSNNAASVHPTVQVGRGELFEIGPTPHVWTRYPRAVIRTLQRNLFTTGRMRPLIIAGIVLLVIARRAREMAILLAIPLYYMCTQSVLHTEYRYILAMHNSLSVIAAVTLYFAGASISQAFGYAKRIGMRPPAAGVTGTGS